MKLKFIFSFVKKEEPTTESASNYHTRQRDLILDAISSFGDSHFTADDLTERLEERNSHVGKTTVYRHLEKLENEGFLRKLFIDERLSACYQQKGVGSCEHFHLKCVKCGKLLHMDCDFMEKICDHVQNEHSFRVDSSRTVFYGECAACCRMEKKRLLGETI